MYLTQQIQNASDLAVLQGIIQSMRAPEPVLSNDQTIFMQKLLWPWWSWVMQKCDGRGRLDNPFIDILTKDTEFIKDNRSRLDRLCEALWGVGVSNSEDRSFVLELVLKLRTECLMRSSTLHRCHCH